MEPLPKNLENKLANTLLSLLKTPLPKSPKLKAKTLEETNNNKTRATIAFLLIID